MNQVAKLRTYRTFKHSFESERYLELNLERHELSLLAQTRSGILPLRVETGRYVGERPEERLCTLCDMRQVEDEQREHQAGEHQAGEHEAGDHEAEEHQAEHQA